MDYYELGQELRRLRQEQGVTQQLMAEHLYMSRATLNAFETGRAGDVGLKKVLAMFNYLGKEISLRDKSPFPTFEELRDAL